MARRCMALLRQEQCQVETIDRRSVVVPAAQLSQRRQDRLLGPLPSHLQCLLERDRRVESHADMQPPHRSRQSLPLLQVSSEEGSPQKSPLVLVGPSPLALVRVPRALALSADRVRASTDPSTIPGSLLLEHCWRNFRHPEGRLAETLRPNCPSCSSSQDTPLRIPKPGKWSDSETTRRAGGSTVMTVARWPMPLITPAHT